MRYEDMTQSQKLRVRNYKCEICGQKFTKLDDVQEIKMKYGRAMLHFEFHSSCLLAKRGIYKFPSQLEEEVKNAETI